jgi:hypothetical protein
VTTADSEQVILYDPGPGEINAVWHLKTLTGKEADTLLEMQNQIIISLLSWAANHDNDPGNKPGSDRETRGNGSRETLELAA